MSLALHYRMGDVHHCSGPHLRNDLYCVEWDVKLYTIPSSNKTARETISRLERETTAFTLPGSRPRHSRSEPGWQSDSRKMRKQVCIRRIHEMDELKKHLAWLASRHHRWCNNDALVMSGANFSVLVLVPKRTFWAFRFTQEYAHANFRSLVWWT